MEKNIRLLSNNFCKLSSKFLIEFIINYRSGMESNIKAINFQVQEVGKHVKNSKKRYTWTFSIEQKLHTLTLDASLISGKMKVTLDDKVLVETELPAGQAFQYPFVHKGYNLNVIQQSDTFDFRINNKVFSHLLNQERTNNAFKRAEDQVKESDFNANPNSFQAKGSMKVNISCINVKKKKNVQSQNWNQISKSSFPNYFGQDSQQKNQVKTQKVQANQDLLSNDNVSQPQTAKFKTNISKQQDFSTMQMLFATKAGVQQTNTQQSPKIDQNQFTTMQQLFATQNPQQNNLNISAFKAEDMNNVQPIYPTQNPKQNMDAQQFNTMQQLFATKCQVQSANTSSIKEQNFTTMQQLFATQNPKAQNMQQSNNFVFDFSALQKSLNPTQNSNENLQLVDQSKIGTNLETMQQLDKTQAVEKTNFFGLQQQIPNTQDFNTMQNLFATINGQNNQIQPTIFKFNNEDQQQQTENLQNFNTMQFMFATNSAQIMKVNQNQPLSQQVNNLDFSTMANLFKTNAYQQNNTNGSQNSTN